MVECGRALEQPAAGLRAQKRGVAAWPVKASPYRIVAHTRLPATGYGVPSNLSA